MGTYFLALGLTILVECGLAKLAMMRGLPAPAVLSHVLFVNLISHPAAHFAVGYTHFMVIELAVVALEAILYHRASDMRFRHAFVFSFILNAVTASLSVAF